MDIQVAALCDSAVDYHGKLCLLGAFDTIVAPRLPAVHPQCSVAVRMVFRKEEEGTHAFALNFVDADGRAIVPAIEMMLEVEVPEEFFFSSRNLVLNLQGLKFDADGQYSVDIRVDGRQVSSIPLQVMLAPAQRPG